MCFLLRSGSRCIRRIPAGSKVFIKGVEDFHDFVVIDQFDVRDRIHTLKPPLLLIRGADDPGSPPEYEMEIHRAVPGSQYLKLNRAGHFPMAEKPEEFNQAIDAFLASRT